MTLSDASSAMEGQTTSAGPLRRNIELKARLRDFEAARRVAQELATSTLGAEHQIDTYFHVPHGRLKLRQINGLTALLIWYSRPDQSQSKRSDYQLVPVSNPETLKLALRGALGVAAVVDKHREIYLWHNVRIHLDQVAGLGAFLEFEAVLQPHEQDATGHAQLAELQQIFGLAEDDLLESSYGNLLTPPCAGIDPTDQRKGGNASIPVISLVQTQRSEE